MSESLFDVGDEAGELVATNESETGSTLTAAQRRHLANLHALTRARYKARPQEGRVGRRVTFALRRAAQHLECHVVTLYRLVDEAVLTRADDGSFFKDELDKVRPRLQQFRARRNLKCPKCGGLLRADGCNMRGLARRYRKCDDCPYRRHVDRAIPGVQPRAVRTPTTERPVEDREGYTVAEAAKALRLSPGCVRERCERLGVTTRASVVRRGGQRMYDLLISPANLRRLAAMPGRGAKPNKDSVLLDGATYWPESPALRLSGYKDHMSLHRKRIPHDAEPLPGRFRARQIDSPDPRHSKIWVFRDEDLRASPLAPVTTNASRVESSRPPAVEANGKQTALPAPKSKYPGHSRKPYKIGRKHDPETEAEMEFCYEQYVIKDLLRVRVFNACVQRFSWDRETADESRVTNNVKRWIQRFEPPLPGRGDPAAQQLLPQIT